MMRHNSGAVLRQVHALLDVGTFAGLSDRQLLDRFLARHDDVSEMSFTVLVERHGPMVLGVCRRILVDPHDAEDAFQATFLVLVRKAASVRVDGSVGRWLFGVATRVATRARADARRRRGLERPGPERLKIVAVEDPLPPVERADLQSILIEEIGRLPARLQAPVILCDLEGCSYERAADQLGWPLGTVKSRLSRARALLRRRLTCRGLVPNDLAITTPLLPMSLPRGLIETTTRATQSLIAGRTTTAVVVSASVANLTEGVLRAMYWTKFKLAVVATLLILGGSAFVFSQVPVRKPVGDRPTGDSASVPDQATPSDAAIDIEMLERAWAAAISRGDLATVNRIIADDFEGIDPISTKATYLSELRGRTVPARPIELEEIKTRIFGDTAVASSRRAASTVPQSDWTTHVYLKREGRWQCVAAHASWIGVITTPTETQPNGREAMSGRMSGMMDMSPSSRVKLGMSPSSRVGGAMSGMMMGMMGRGQGSKPNSDGNPQVMKPDQGGKEQVSKPDLNGSQGVPDADGNPSGMKPDPNDNGRGMSGLPNGQGQMGGNGPMMGQAGGMGTMMETMRNGGVARSQGMGQNAAVHRPAPVQEPIPVRLQFGFRVEKVFVEPGQDVKEGDPLLEVFSTELMEAKSNYEVARTQWNHDKKVYDYKAPLAKENTLAAKELIEAENNEAQSRLKMKLAKDRLLVYGLTAAEIGRIPDEEGEGLARFRLRSRVNGKVSNLNAFAGNDYNRSNVLMEIQPTSVIMKSLDTRSAPRQ